MTRFDIAREAKADQPVVEKTFRGLRPNAQGKLVLSFVPVKSYAVVTALEVADETTPPAKPTQTALFR